MRHASLTLAIFSFPRLEKSAVGQPEELIATRSGTGAFMGRMAPIPGAVLATVTTALPPVRGIWEPASQVEIGGVLVIP